MSDLSAQEVRPGERFLTRCDTLKAVHILSLVIRGTEVRDREVTEIARPRNAIELSSQKISGRDSGASKVWDLNARASETAVVSWLLRSSPLISCQN
jgi:hypothetical protein